MRKVNQEFESNQYDRIYAEGGTQKIYDLPYRHSGYYPLFREVARTLWARGTKAVLEVGCGTGGLAHLLQDEGRVNYRGFDFSPVAVERARARVGGPNLYFVGDARDAANYVGDYDTIVCTEVLEHIEADLEVIASWAPGIGCVCSVPNFDADNHVRFFRSEDEVRSRYGKLLDIGRVVRVKKPFLGDISWASYARALRWNRYRPSRLAAIAGLSSFDNAGGWFVFSGRRRPAPD